MLKGLVLIKMLVWIKVLINMLGVDVDLRAGVDEGNEGVDAF